MTATIMCTYMYMYLCIYTCVLPSVVLYHEMPSSAVTVAAEANAPTLVPQGMCAMRVFSVCLFKLQAQVSVAFYMTLPRNNHSEVAHT